MAGSAVVASLLESSEIPAIDGTIDSLGSDVPTRLIIIGPDGQVVADSQGDPGVDGADASNRGSEGPGRRRRGNSLVVTVPISSVPDAYAQASAPLDDVDDAVERFQ